MGCLVVACCGCTQGADTSWKRLLTTTKQERQGDALFEQGQYDEAERAYHDALKEGASPASIAYRIGQLRLAQQQNEAALEAFHQAVELDDNMAKAHAGAGKAALKLGRYEDAATALGKAATLAPQDWTLLVYLTATELALKQPDAAKLARNQAIRVTGNPALVDQSITEVVSTLPSAPSSAQETKHDDLSETIHEDVPGASSDVPETNQTVEHNDHAIELDAFIKQQQEALARTKRSSAIALDTVGEHASDRADNNARAVSDDVMETEANEQQSEAPADHGVLALLHDPKWKETATHKSTHYVLLESSYAKEDAARERARALEQMGVTATTDAMIMGRRGIWYRVLIGSHPSLEVAKHARDELAKNKGLTNLVILKMDD